MVHFSNGVERPLQLFVGSPENNVPANDPHGTGGEALVEGGDSLPPGSLKGAVEDGPVGPAGAVHVPRLDDVHRAGEQRGDEAGHACSTEVADHSVSEEVFCDQEILKVYTCLECIEELIYLGHVVDNRLTGVDNPVPPDVGPESPVQPVYDALLPGDANVSVHDPVVSGAPARRLHPDLHHVHGLGHADGEAAAGEASHQPQQESFAAVVRGGKAGPAEHACRRYVSVEEKILDISSPFLSRS